MTPHEANLTMLLAEAREAARDLRCCLDTLTAAASADYARGWRDAIEKAATAVYQPDRVGREWVRGSLWDSLLREAATAILALTPPLDTETRQGGGEAAGRAALDQNAGDRV